MEAVRRIQRGAEPSIFQIVSKTKVETKLDLFGNINDALPKARQLLWRRKMVEHVKALVKH